MKRKIKYCLNIAGVLSYTGVNMKESSSHSFQVEEKWKKDRKHISLSIE